MDTPIRQPFLERKSQNLQIQKAVQPDNGDSSVFLPNSFVVLSGGLLVAVATAGVLVYGWSADKSHLSTDHAPDALYGQNHWPFDPTDAQFVMNITDNSGHIGQAAGAPQLSVAVVGTSYGIYKNTGGYQMVNISDTTNKLFTVMALYPNQALTDYNGRVIVKVIDTCIQA